MKDYLIIIGVFCLILLSNFITNSYTKKCTQQLIVSLDELSSLLGDKENSEEKIDKILKKWDENNEILSFYIEHDELEKLKTNLITVKYNISTNQVEDAIEKIEVAKFVVNHIEDKYEVKLANVF